MLKRDETWSTSVDANEEIYPTATNSIDAEILNEEVSTEKEEVLPQTNTKAQGMGFGMVGAMLALFGAVGLNRKPKSDMQ